MKTVVLSCYDINPYKGSESGTGWNFSHQISKHYNVIAITRENNKDKIDEFIDKFNIDTSNLSFEYYDLPYYLRFWKKGNRGSFIYYNLWQIGLPLFILRKKLKFDFTQHINFHADHVPSFLWILGKPFIWGPINHNEPMRKFFIRSNSYLLQDRFKFLLKWLRWNLDPFLILCKNKAALIIGSSVAVKERLNIKDNKFKLLTTVSSQIPHSRFNKEQILSTNEKFTVISVGRLVPIKSFDISINSFDLFYKRLSYEQKKLVQLKIVGSGPSKKKLVKLASQLESRNSIHFIDWIDQSDLFKLYMRSNIMLTPSHEGAGAVLAEGFSYGLPIICFNGYGSGEIIDSSCGIKVDINSNHDTNRLYADAIESLYKDDGLYSELSRGALKKFNNELSWEIKGKMLHTFYMENVFNEQ